MERSDNGGWGETLTIIAQLWKCDAGLLASSLQRLDMSDPLTGTLAAGGRLSRAGEHRAFIGSIWLIP